MDTMIVFQQKKPRSRRRMSAEERAEAKLLSKETVRQRMAVYAQFREALVLISGLPRASDMAKLAKAYDRSKYVEKRIPDIAQWMREFEDAWTNGHDHHKASPKK